MRLPTASLAVVLTVAALGAGSLSLPAPAPASSWNELWMYMHFPATSKDNRCVYRWITTGPGHYRWRMFSNHWAHPDPGSSPPARRLWLRRARYRWVDCWSRRGDGYRHSSRLFNDSHGGMAEITGDDEYGRWGDGRYHWGSTLDRVR